MKKSFKKFLTKVSSVALSVFMLASFSISAIALDEKVKKQYITVAADMADAKMEKNPYVSAQPLLAKSETLYVKDVRFVTGDSLEDAKKNVPEGYIMKEEDLNQGAAYITSVEDVYLVYSTTTNPDEAITDIKMMNMKGGFVFSNYETGIEKLSDEVKNMVYEFEDAVETFVVNYKKGMSGAKAAYRTLSFFTIPEEDNQNLADYFIYGQVKPSFYFKILLNTHTDILATILSALAMAVQSERGNTWIERLTKVYDPEEITDSRYWDKAGDLLPHFESFYEAYSSIDHTLWQNGNGPIHLMPDESGNPGIDISDKGKDSDVDITGGEIFYEMAYAVLKHYKFGNGTSIGDWLVNDYLYEEMLYALIDVLTPGEYAMMHLCGPMYMTLATSMSEEVYKDYVARTEDIFKQTSSCSVWAGVNTDLLRSSIGITDRACRAIVETEAEQQFNDEGDTGMETALKAAGLLAAVGAVALGVGMLTVMVFGSSIFAGLVGSAAVAFTAQWAVVTSIAGVTCASAGVVGIVIALVIVVVFLVVWLIDWIAGLYPDYTDIPEYMYDYIIDDSDMGKFILYEAAKDQNGEPVDVNAFDGKEWHAPYISRDKAAGAPIEADFIVRTGSGHLDDGYSALSAFGNINCENLNRYAFDDDVHGIFVSYRQEDLKGNYARSKYLSSVKLFTAEHEEECKIKVKNEDYTLYNVNLTPDADYCTYIGYQMTDRATNALTDLRFAYNYTSMQYSAGGGNLTYGASGTSGDLTLFTTRIDTFGSPITSNFVVVNDINDAPAGYEPVNMFSGGPAVSLNMDDSKKLAEKKPFYLYFLPSKAYVSGTEYLGGLATTFDVQASGSSIGNNDNIDETVGKLNYQKLATIEGNHNMEGAIMYTTTYNPYRAIYDIGAMSNGDEMGKYLSETITYDGVGYILTTRFAVTDELNEKTKIKFDSTIRDDDSRLYIAGPGFGGNPMTLDDIIISDSADEMIEGFKAVNGFLGTSGGKAVNISEAFNYKFKITTKRTIFMIKDPAYMYIRGKAYEEGKYLTSMFIASKEQVLDGQDVDCSKLDKSYVMASLSAQGAHTVFDKNLNLKDGGNATYLGYTKNAGAKDYIRDMILYYAGDTDQEPEPECEKNGIRYQIVSYVNIFCPENKEDKKCKRVYLYATTNPAAGSPILDIKIDNNAILDGWETVRTQNEKALYADMDAHSSNMWFIHMKRQTEEPKYISEIVIGWGSDSEAKAMLLEAGCNYMLTKDLNDGVGILSNYIYLGYKRTSDPNQAIRDVMTVHNEKKWTTYTKNGATYYKVEGNLNSFTNYFADDIFIFYTKDAAAGNPIISLGTSGDVANWTHGDGGKYVVTTVVNQKGKYSDLNDGALGDYIYLLQTRDKTDPGVVASMIGNGSVLIIITFTALSACVVEGLYIIKKKREGKGNNKDNSQAESGE